MTGLGLFGTQAREPGGSPTQGSSGPQMAPLGIADLNEAFERVSGGLAFVVPSDAPDAFDPERRLAQVLKDTPSEGTTLDHFARLLLHETPGSGPATPVHTESFQLMRYEVTRGQWAEFLDEAEKALAQLERTSWIRALWLPRTEKERASSRRYVEAWLEAASATLTAEQIARARETLQRPLTAEARMLLLAPPAWVIVADDQDFDWRMPAGTTNFPVSGISGIDAEIFVAWARPAVRMAELRLPTIAEFRRAFHHGKPPTLQGGPGAWPWGDAWRPLHFNNRRYQRHTVQSGPIDVYGPNVLGEGQRHENEILGLAGNVAEWVLPISLRRRGEKFEANEADVQRRRAMQVAGGSYLDEPEACRHILWPAYERERRLPHVGFRLALSESTMLGGPR